MIIIVSNGKSYSDHRLYFVEADSAASVEAVMNPADPDDPSYFPNEKARVVGTCEYLAWVPGAPKRSGAGETMNLATFASLARGYL